MSHQASEIVSQEEKIYSIFWCKSTQMIITFFDICVNRIKAEKIHFLFNGVSKKTPTADGLLLCNDGVRRIRHDSD